MGFVRIILGFLLVFLTELGPVESCYFQQEFQGEYVMQSSVPGAKVQYSSLNITATSIPVWGNCHKRVGNKYILRMSHEETSCIRCFHLKLRSANVLQMITSHSTFSKCYINEEQAEKRCPGEENVESKDVTEILLFKIKDVNEAPTAKKYCPLDGKYSIMYNSKITKSQRKLECNGLESAIDSCPSGSTLNVKLKGCNAGINDFKFECLGSWEGTKGETFIIFNDNRQHKPKYRCAIYEEEIATGRIFMALSNDSTCITDLYNATTGSETFILTPKEALPWPADVISGDCFFPEWMQGNWEHIRVSRDTLIFQDHTSYKTYTIKCAAFQEMENKYLVFSRSQCNEENYSCMWIHKRTDNILEFQMGNKYSNSSNPFDLCHDANFVENSWITQGRRTAVVPSTFHQGMCPISGEYTGVIPDDTNLCAKLWSDCSAEIMYYQVLNCDTKEIYEEREYHCLGHWREDNLLYTYTKRVDVAPGTYECFVGSITPNEEIFIKEAGSHCQRNINPVRDGMQLFKARLHSCVDKVPVTDSQSESNDLTTERTPTKPSTTITTTTVGLTKSTRKPWNFENDINEVEPKTTSPNRSHMITSILYFHIFSLSFVLFL